MKLEHDLEDKKKGSAKKDEHVIGSDQPLKSTNHNKLIGYGACDKGKSSDGKEPPEWTRVEINGKTITSGGGCENGTGDTDQGGQPKEAQLSKLEVLAKRIPCLGIMLALGASVFLGSAGMLVKMTTSVHGIQVAVFRAIIQLIVYSCIMAIRNLPIMPLRGERWPVMLRASLGSASITFSYYALKLIPLGDATTIRFSLPIWTLIISYLVLNESCSLFKIFAVIISISGVLLIAKPDDVVRGLDYIWHNLGFTSSLSGGNNGTLINNTIAMAHSSGSHYNYDQAELIAMGLISSEDEIISGPPLTPIAIDIANDNHNQLIGCLLALSSSICLSMSLIALRLCNKTPAEITIFWLSLLSIAIGSITLLAIGEWRLPNNWLDVLYIFLNGICGTLGQWFITSALKVEQSGVISLARTFDIQVAFLYSAFLLHEQIRATSIVGSIMVSGGVVAVVIPKWLESRKLRREKRDERKAQEEAHEEHQRQEGASIDSRKERAI